MISRLLCAIVCLGVLAGVSRVYAGGSGASAGEKFNEVTESTKATLEQAGTEAVNKADEIWRRIDESRLKNRTRDQIVAWVIVGLLVGNLVGFFTAGQSTFSQRLGFIVLGLIGAFLGGIIVNVAQLDFGLGPVLIRYEDLLVSVIGGFVLLGVVRFLVARKRKRALVKASKAIAEPAHK